MLSLLIFILFFQILAQIGLLLSFIILFFKGQDIDNMIIFKFILVGLKKYLRSWCLKFHFRGSKKNFKKNYIIYIYIYLPIQGVEIIYNIVTKMLIN